VLPLMDFVTRATSQPSSQRNMMALLPILFQLHGRRGSAECRPGSASLK
jgi:hypothetical protein